MALIANVVTGGTITAAWGNAVRDATIQVTTASARPTSPSEGMVIYETDTDRLLVWDGSAWIRIAQSTTTGRTGCTVRNTTSTAIGNGALHNPTFNTKDYDSDTFITTPSGTITIPTGLGGLYSVAFSTQITAAASPFPVAAAIKVTTSGTSFGYGSPGTGFGNINVSVSGTIASGGIAVVMPLVAGDSLTFNVGQGSGGTQNVTLSRADVYRIGA